MKFLSILIKKIEEYKNIIIINKRLKEIERFDPNQSEDSILDKNLQDFLIPIFSDYKYISILDYCPISVKNTIGSKFCQLDNGSCITLTQIYGLLRILNLEYTRKEIINVMKTYNSFILRKFNTFVNMLS